MRTNETSEQYTRDADGQWYFLQKRKKVRKSDGQPIVVRLKVHPRICEYCGSEFVNRHPTARMCSNECNHASQKGKHKKPEGPRQCPICGEDFHRKVRRPWRETCSPKCARALGNQGRGRPGDQNPNWKGGRRYHAKSGYVIVYVSTGVSALEHRVVMEEIIGRPLERYEEVHHRNSIRDDNRPENLELWVKRQPGGARAKDLIAYAHWVLETYGPIADRL